MSDANVFINTEGAKDNDLRNKIRKSIKDNKEAVKKFLLSEENELHLEFQQNRVTRKRSGMNSNLSFDFSSEKAETFSFEFNL